MPLSLRDSLNQISVASGGRIAESAGKGGSPSSSVSFHDPASVPAPSRARIYRSFYFRIAKRRVSSATREVYMHRAAACLSSNVNPKTCRSAIALRTRPNWLLFTCIWHASYVNVTSGSGDCALSMLLVIVEIPLVQKAICTRRPAPVVLRSLANSPGLLALATTAAIFNNNPFQTCPS